MVNPPEVEGHSMFLDLSKVLKQVLGEANELWQVLGPGSSARPPLAPSVPAVLMAGVPYSFSYLKCVR